MECELRGYEEMRRKVCVLCCVDVIVYQRAVEGTVWSVGKETLSALARKKQKHKH